MAARVQVLHEGYVGDRVGSTVCLVSDGDRQIIIDPGMVADRARILGPLEGLGVSPASVTDVIFSHHHPDHTVNCALFPDADIHDFHATYRGDKWIERTSMEISPCVRLMLTPGHTDEDVTTLIDTEDGLVCCTHLWWGVTGPIDDPYSRDLSVLAASREAVLALAPTLIIPGHGRPFSVSEIKGLSS